jgi:hypothetical protein
VIIERSNRWPLMVRDGSNCERVRTNFNAWTTFGKVGLFTAVLDRFRVELTVVSALLTGAAALACRLDFDFLPHRFPILLIVVPIRTAL